MKVSTMGFRPTVTDYRLLLRLENKLNIKKAAVIRLALKRLADQELSR